MAEKMLPPSQEPRFLGMIANSSTDLPEGAVLLAQNFFLRDGVWVMRPGCAQLGADLGTAIQGMVGWEELDGTLHFNAISAGDLYEYDWGTGSWSLVDGTLTLDPNAYIDFAVSRGRLIITDGVNSPLMWDGATFTTLTDAPIAGGVMLYYDKVFFYDLPGSSSNVFEWSDEGDPTTGYSIAGQDWEFAQTDHGAVLELVPLNSQFLVLKGDSVSQVRGPVEDTFQTDAVREGVSESTGALGSRTSVVVNGDVFYLTPDGPRVALGGQGPAQDIADTGDGIDALKDVWSTLDKAEWAESFGTYLPTTQQILWFVPTDTGSTIYTAIVYSLDEPAWSVFEFNFGSSIEVATVVEDTSGDEHLVLGLADGTVMQYDSGWDDNGNAVERILRSRLYGRSQAVTKKRLVQVWWRLNLHTAITSAESRANQDNTVEDPGASLAITPTGRQVYRRGFDHAGYGVGWELYMNTAGEAFDVEAATTFMSIIESFPSV